MLPGAYFGIPILRSSRFEVMPHRLWRVVAETQLCGVKPPEIAQGTGRFHSPALAMTGTPRPTLDGCAICFVIITLLFREPSLNVRTSHRIQAMTRVTRSCDAPHRIMRGKKGTDKGPGTAVFFLAGREATVSASMGINWRFEKSDFESLKELAGFHVEPSATAIDATAVSTSRLDRRFSRSSIGAIPARYSRCRRVETVVDSATHGV